MMYKNDFVAVVKANGKILREDKNTVYIPFGEEYAILMKNLFGRKALVSISVDGTNVGKKLIIDANSEIELDCFINDLAKNRRFKFIQKTEKIQEHRGDKIDDGIIRIEFQFEKEKVQSPIYNPWYNQPTYYDNTTYRKSVNTDCLRGTLSNNTNCSFSPSSSSMNSRGIDTPLADEGITVKGSESSQTFKLGYIDDLEDEKHVITLQLKGFTDNGKEIKEPVTVKAKKVCTTCGTTNKQVSKYCRECGTFLE